MRQLVFCTAAILLMVLTGCVQAPPIPQRTQLEIREFQTRIYPSNNIKMIMKAAINTLQDDGFMIRNADKELGFISASKEIDVSDQTEAVFVTIFGGENARYKKNSTIESSVNISEFGKETKVRAVFQTKVVDNYGSPISTYTIEDPAFYQDFFSKVDKGIFIEREGL